MLNSREEVSNRELQKAEDFKEQVNDLVSMAKAKAPEAKPCSGNKDFDSCVTGYNKNLRLWYNDKTGNTKVIEKRID